MFESRAASAEDQYLTPRQLSERWLIDPGSLANLRSRGEGPPFLKLENGSVRYRVADVLAVETDAARGFSFQRLETALAACPAIEPQQITPLMEFLRRALMERRRRPRV